MGPDYKGTVEVQCEFCGSRFFVYKSSIKVGAKFCSSSCYHESSKGRGAMGGLVIKTCKQCKQSFKVPRHRTEKEQKEFFCSRDCYHEWFRVWKRRYWVNKICAYCKKSFLVRPILARRRRYCSWDCFEKDFNIRQFGRRGQNGSEKRLGALLVKFGFEFVGDGNLKVGTYFPDFVHKRKKLLVEMFGNHWHKPSEVGFRIDSFEKYGYRCLVVWESELSRPENILSKVRKFITK